MEVKALPLGSVDRRLAGSWFTTLRDSCWVQVLNLNRTGTTLMCLRSKRYKPSLRADVQSVYVLWSQGSSCSRD